MSNVQFILHGITIVGLFGSLAFFTPDTPWRDVSIFFRKNKQEYIKFSNRARSKVWIFTSICSAILLILSLIVDLPVNPLLVFTVYGIILLIAFAQIEGQWRRYKNESTNSH